MIKLNKRRFLLVFMALLTVFLLCITASAKESDTPETVASDSDPLVSLSYVNEVLKPQIIAEVLEKVGSGEITTAGSVYNDINLEGGKMLMLGTDCEFIYRGGGAVIITTSPEEGDGVADMSDGQEFFSGKSLQFGHVYYASESDAVKYILITGERAYFTIRGNYEIG